jgi:hypothetical protein
VKGRGEEEMMEIEMLGGWACGREEETRGHVYWVIFSLWGVGAVV